MNKSFKRYNWQNTIYCLKNLSLNWLKCFSQRTISIDSIQLYIEFNYFNTLMENPRSIQLKWRDPIGFIMSTPSYYVCDSCSRFVSMSCHYINNKSFYNISLVFPSNLLLMWKKARRIWTFFVIIWYAPLNLKLHYTQLIPQNPLPFSSFRENGCCMFFVVFFCSVYLHIE